MSFLERELVGSAAGHDLLAADDLEVILPDGVVEGVAHHEAGPLGGPDLAEGGGGQAEHEDGSQAEHLEGESEGGRKEKWGSCGYFLNNLINGVLRYLLQRTARRAVLRGAF